MTDVAPVGLGRVIGLFTAPSAGAAVEPREWVDVVPGLGIPGDRYATGRGHWSDPKWPDQELTLIEAEVADDLGLDPGRLRRNVVTRDIQLLTLIGATFQIGEAVLVGIRPCDPCGYLDTLTRPGVAKGLAGRGGLRVKIREGGRIRLGDPIVRLP